MLKFFAARFAALALGLGLFAAPAAYACPDFSLPPTYGSASLAAGFLPDPYTISVDAGGPFSVSTCRRSDWNFTNGGSGWVAAAPDFSLNWRGGGGPLTIWIESAADTVIIVNTPDGVFHFNDDTQGDLRAGLTFVNPIDGRYDIWVGTYSSGALQPSVLHISELI